MKLTLILMFITALWPVAVPPAFLWEAAASPRIALQQPTPQPEDGAAQPGVSLRVWLALVCVFNLSLVALLGAIAMRRRIDSFNPDK